MKPATKSAGTKKPTVITAVTARVGNQGFSTTPIMHNIQIDREFQALIPPLSADERTQLEANILADGCRDPLVVWETSDGQNILIDGHNRYEICTRLGSTYEVEWMQFDERSDVIEWIIKNQFGRRNLSDYQRGVLALRMKPIMEERAKAQQIRKPEEVVSQKSDEQKPIRTDEAVSELANVSRDTIRKIERIEEVAQPEVKALASAGEVSIHLASQFVELPQEVQQEAIAAIAEHHEPAKEVMREAVKKAHVANNSGNNEWYTPPKFIELARQVMGGIDLDPATSEVANRVVQAPKIFTAEDDGRTQQWNGRVWMNPPYAQPLMGDFAEAVASKYESGEIEQACILVNNGTETQWFQRMLGAADAVCFPKTRIKFIDPEGNPSGAPLQGQAILYMGGNVAAFTSLFAEEGVVLTHA